ncbi:acyl carrier protein [Ammoniphilus sp. CFH 90114]|uniref:acyl carrier protein n=1 Tax=Ammoniphilus sp. CFH 90114 TaxID=2493665 RepID=UPI00100DB72E|nr:acyl carrier protein [Ammoniphilus sp. CFH 90114]RXT13591.1 acyl carrier protein [Ammoniphilus sp. CFH 90114]
MNEQQLKEELREMIAATIEIDDFADDENFVQDLGVDSMMALEIVARIEKAYRIQIAEEELTNLQSLNQVVAVVIKIMNENETKEV